MNAEKEEVEAYKHLQKTSELSRTRTEEQLSKSLSECTNLERRVAALEQDLDIEKREHNRTKGFLAGVRVSLVLYLSLPPGEVTCNQGWVSS